MCGIVKVCVHTYLLIYLLFWKISQQQAVCHTSTFFWSMGIQWCFVLFAQEQAARRYSSSKSLSQKFFWSIVKKLWTFAVYVYWTEVYYCGFYYLRVCMWIYKTLVTHTHCYNYDLKSAHFFYLHLIWARWKCPR